MADEFHKGRTDWARIKHHILGNYIRLYVGKVGLYNPVIYYVDGFAGQGVYGDNQVGSAFIGADTAVNPIQKSRAGMLRCINVEEDADTFAELEANLAKHKASGLVENYHGTFQQHLPAILQKIGTHPAFFFIDPFGSKGAEIETLKTIRTNRDRSEILVRYDDTRVKRLISWAAKNLDSYNEGHRKSAENFAKRVSQLTDELAVEVFQANDAEAREWLIEGYMNKARDEAGYRYALHYPIRNPKTGGHKYFLVHFCNHADGYHSMANFMAKAERAYEKTMREAVDMFAASDQEVMPGIIEGADQAIEENRVAELVSALPKILQKLRPRGGDFENRDLYSAIVDQFRWRLTRKEWIKAIRKAHDNGLVEFVKSDDGSISTIRDK